MFIFLVSEDPKGFEGKCQPGLSKGRISIVIPQPILFFKKPKLAFKALNLVRGRGASR